MLSCQLNSELHKLQHGCHVLTCKACAFLGFDFLRSFVFVIVIGQRSQSNKTTESKARTDGTTANRICTHHSILWRFSHFATREVRLSLTFPACFSLSAVMIFVAFSVSSFICAA